MGVSSSEAQSATQSCSRGTFDDGVRSPAVSVDVSQAETLNGLCFFVGVALYFAGLGGVMGEIASSPVATATRHFTRHRLLCLLMRSVCLAIIKVSTRHITMITTARLRTIKVSAVVL